MHGREPPRVWQRVTAAKETNTPRLSSSRTFGAGSRTKTTPASLTTPQPALALRLTSVSPGPGCEGSGYARPTYHSRHAALSPSRLSLTGTLRE